MGFFGKLFNSENKRKKIADGAWLDGERVGDWVGFVASHNGARFEYSDYSCFTDNEGTYCLMRAVHEEKKVVRYFGVWIWPDEDDYVFIPCERLEHLDGSLIKADSWSATRALGVDDLKGVADLIRVTRRLAAARNHKTTPSYVLILKYGALTSTE